MQARQQLAEMKAAKGVKTDVELDAADLKALVAKYKEVYVANGKTLPQDPWEQLHMGIDAVFRCCTRSARLMLLTLLNTADITADDSCTCVMRGHNVVNDVHH